ncbi:hypothetical protein [Streptomyces fumanus]|uniref:hypothetical protein n=1 Tax=Streptomyces fumanus TaxID=67302 RepID=UPI0033DD9963
MPSTPEDRHDFSAARPVEAEPGALVHTTADRGLTIEQWLLSTHPSPRHARTEWLRHGVTLFPLGDLFSAIRLPGRLVQALASSTDPVDADAFLADALDGNPVICDMQGPRYYVLVPASVPRTWHDAADDWRRDDVECLGRNAYLGVPHPSATRFPERGIASYWSVPMASVGELCAPLTVARLIAAGVHVLADRETVWPVDTPLTPRRPSTLPVASRTNR